ncbi:hypothetical protein JTB14_018465 [Gonioctena quinquepunctata]|nr:hypothetical protein JTB14_018465 [Gonioctena quinquepunctata]
MKSCGMIHETAIPHCPQQNVMAERLNRTLVEKTRAMLQDPGLSQRYWGEAILTSIHLKNRCPSAAIPRFTPEQLWTGSKVDLRNLRVFGSTAHSIIPSAQRSKLEPKSKQYLVVGHCEQSKGHKLAYPSHRSEVIKARNVIFVEESPNENTIEDECNMKTVDMPSSANTEDICVMSGMEGNGNGSSVPNIQNDSAATIEEKVVTDLSSWDHISIVDEEIE